MRIIAHNVLQGNRCQAGKNKLGAASKRIGVHGQGLLHRARNVPKTNGCKPWNAAWTLYCERKVCVQVVRRNVLLGQRPLVVKIRNALLGLSAQKNLPPRRVGYATNAHVPTTTIASLFAAGAGTNGLFLLLLPARPRYVLRLQPRKACAMRLRKRHRPHLLPRLRPLQLPQAVQSPKIGLLRYSANVE